MAAQKEPNVEPSTMTATSPNGRSADVATASRPMIQTATSTPASSRAGTMHSDISVPTHRMPDFVQQAVPLLEAAWPGTRAVGFGHLGDGNVHFNVSQPVGADSAQFLARWGEINDAVNKIVLKYNGSISAEHGIGTLKRSYLHLSRTPAELALMKRLKQALDPKGILNPGKVI